jgi:hypothetical protein
MRLVYQIQISPKRISGSTVAESPNQDHNRVESAPKVNGEDLSFSQKLSGFADDNIGDAIGHRVQSLDSYKRRLHSYKTREDIAMELVFKPVTQQDSDTRINTALDTKENSASKKVIAVLAVISLPAAVTASFFSISQIKGTFNHLLRFGYFLWLALVMFRI